MTFFAWLLLVCMAILFLPGTNIYRHKHKPEDFAWDEPWIYLALASNIAAIVLALEVVLS